MRLYFSFRTSLACEDLVLQALVWDEELYRSTSFEDIALRWNKEQTQKALS